MPSVFHRLIARTPRSVERDTVALELDDGRRLEVQRVRDPRAKRLKLSVDERGARLTLPWRASLVSGDRFLQQHRDWLAEQLARHDKVRYPRWAMRDRRLRRYGEAAVLTGTLAFAIQPHAAPKANDVELLVTEVWAESSGAWRLVAFHACRPAAPGTH